jgi:NAD(P)-dependent dehydrogenase (short-subunit alcohol dehydrogenase family)
MSVLFRLIRNKWISPPKDVKESYTGRNIIVTGATSGIGLEAVVKFAQQGASKVIIAARDLSRGEAVRADIASRTGKYDQLEVWELDMNSFPSVVAFAQRAQSLEHLDIAVLNAGIRRVPFVQSKHGWEEDLQVNTLSTALLGILLLPKLKDSKRFTGKIPTLEFVNSGLHQGVKIKPAAVEAKNILQTYNTQELFSPQHQYAISKLFLMFATNKLAEETSSSEVIITSICPGMVATGLARDVKFPGVTIVLAIVSFLLLKAPEAGARLITSGIAQGERIHGRFWQHDKIQPIAPSLTGEKNKEIALRVWNEIVEILEKEVPSTRDVLAGITRNT